MGHEIDNNHAKKSFASDAIPSHDEVKQAIIHRNQHDPFRYNDIKFGLVINDVSRSGLTVTVTYSFIYDPSEKDEQDRALFHYTKDFAPGFFPDSIDQVTLGETFTWESEAELYAFELSECKESDAWVEARKSYFWDDPDFPPELFNWAIENGGIGYPDAIAATLINDLSAGESMPNSIPRSLHPYFQKLITNYKLGIY